MDEFVKVRAGTIGKTRGWIINARDLWKYLESKQQFADWIKRRLSNCCFEEGVDYTCVKVIVKGNSKRHGNIVLKEYIINLDVASYCCTISKTEKGFRLRRYLWNLPDYIEDSRDHREQQIMSMIVSQY